MKIGQSDWLKSSLCDVIFTPLELGYSTRRQLLNEVSILYIVFKRHHSKSRIFERMENLKK